MKWYYATIMKRLVISLVAIVSLLLIGSSAFVIYVTNQPEIAPVASTQPVKPEQKPPTVDELLRLVNAERAKVGVAPLVIDERLNQSAQKKSDDMFTNNYFGHVSPVDNRHGYEYAHDVMPECSQVSENIFWGRSTNTSQSAIDWWMNSEPHRLALQDSKYTLTGFGISGAKITEHFCQLR